MADKNRDIVFQLSLTEIAFILVFLLLLLLGMLFFKAKKDNNEIKITYEVTLKKLNDYENIGSYEQLSKRYQALQNNIEKYLQQKAIPDSKRVMDDLVSVAKLDKEISDLKKKLEKSVLEEKSCKAFTNENGKIKTDELSKIVEENQKLKLVLDELKAKGVEVNSADELKEIFLKNTKEFQKLRVKCGGGGIGACWLDENDKTQNLLNIILEPEYASIKVADLPDNRMQEMKLLPKIELATRTSIPYTELDKSFGPILQWSKNRTPECRHYVTIQSNIPLTKDSKPKRLQVQQYFYPDESVK